MASSRYRQLLRRLNFLENNILPVEKLNGNYTKKEQDLIRSFVLLSHAEIEAYLENRAKDKINRALNAWLTNRKKSNSLKSVLAFSGNEINFLNDNNAKSIEHRIRRTVAHYINSTIQKNNGVKEKNILSLLLPLGIELNEIDPTWLRVMDTFGAIRGNIAHNTHSVQNIIDRNTELDRIKNQIIPELETIDELITKLK